jgi:hypothetical protein
VPLVWCGIEHPRAAVASEEYQGGLEKAATRVPVACNVVLLADRGFAETELMHHLQRLGGHLRLRITSTFWISRPGDGGVQVRARSLVPGHTRFWHGVLLTTKRFGLVHLAVARPLGSAEYWYGISDEPTAVRTWEADGLRFASAEHFWDDKAKGVPLEAALRRSATALERWCFVLARTTLSLGSVGTSVVQQGKRRFVDPQGFRGTSSLKRGWKWVRYALSRGSALLTSVSVSSASDPEPAVASKKQAQRRQERFVFAYQDVAYK